MRATLTWLVLVDSQLVRFGTNQALVQHSLNDSITLSGYPFLQRMVQVYIVDTIQKLIAIVLDPSVLQATLAT